MQAAADAGGGLEALFATETMAELCARQGRVGEAAAIFAQLLRNGPGDARAARWTERLAALRTGASVVAALAAVAAPVPARSAPVVIAPEADEYRQPLVVRETVRSGQLVYARGTDLIVLAPVNPGAELMADGHIHVYATLRGRAVAGARGAKDARVFCQRLEAELVGVDAAYITAEALPPALRGKPAQVWLDVGLDGDRCVVTPL